MKRLTRDEFPNTRKEFLKRWNDDHVFRARAINMGFTVIGENVIFPDGQVANHTVK